MRQKQNAKNPHIKNKRLADVYLKEASKSQFGSANMLLDYMMGERNFQKKEISTYQKEWSELWGGLQHYSVDYSKPFFSNDETLAKKIQILEIFV